MNNLDYIRPYHDHEVNDGLKELRKHPMIKALLTFALPDKTLEEMDEILDNCHSIRDFQTKIIYHAVRQVIERSSEGFFSAGFDDLEPGVSYLFISNHRDIVLDTSFINTILFEKNLVMTASAIGDNLVHKPFLLGLSKLNRNFLVQRNLPPKEMLESSKMLSGYIRDLLQIDHRSVWIAQREGRTKDGNDRSQQGVLKMIGLARGEMPIMEYFKSLRVVPISISYEYDPTDILKMPELIAKENDETYVKTSNEDFNSILQGALGNKKRICIVAGEVLDKEFDEIAASGEPVNKQLGMLTECIDCKIHQNYRLWPSNYVAYDLYYHTDKYSKQYDDKEKRQFERRLEKRIDSSNPIAVKNFLLMYANPVINKEASAQK